MAAIINLKITETGMDLVSAKDKIGSGSDSTNDVATLQKIINYLTSIIAKNQPHNVSIVKSIVNTVDGSVTVVAGTSGTTETLSF